MKFEPCYVWPNEYFPFRVFFKNEKLTIFIIEGIVHNFNWLNKYKNFINEKHFFFVSCPWYMSEFHAHHYNEMFQFLNLNKDNFFFLFNSNQEENFLKNKGFFGEIINQNCWINENLYKVCDNITKKYNAVLIACKVAYKRHYLANKIKKLAIINEGWGDEKQLNYKIPECDYQNKDNLNIEEVVLKINESYCGLFLSAEDGACGSSSECLLCGIPVVSTQSVGGRDLWYNEYNSYVCESDEEEDVWEGVEYFLRNNRDPNKIRNDHITLAKEQRKKFVNCLQKVFEDHQIDFDAKTYLNLNYFNKMLKSQKPNFNEIFAKE
jgi:hypothetical protein